MKAITILQPWASLIACGAKKIETRSWPTKYRGPIAIHAGKAIDRGASLTNPIYRTLTAAGLDPGEELTTGAVIAIAELVDCVKMVGVVNGSMGPFEVPVFKAELENGMTVRGNEFAFGHYEIGRYAWILENVRAIEPIPAKGMQRIWEWRDTK